MNEVSDASDSVYSLDSAPVFATDEVLNNNSAFDGTNDESDVYVVKSSESEIENIDADTFYLQVSLATVRRLKFLKHRALYSFLKRIEFSNLFHDFFDGMFNDLSFMTKMAKEFSFDSVSDLTNFINIDKTQLKKAGRPLTSKDLHQEIYDYWISCELSNDRRNARHVIKVKKQKLNILIQDLIDENISDIVT